MTAQPSPVAAASREPVPALSLRLWDLDWSRLLPLKLTDVVSVELGTFEQAEPFITDHYTEIFGAADGRFLVEPPTTAKRRFCMEADFFLFIAEGKTVGLLMCHPTDWSTYYLRSGAFISEHRDRGLMQSFLVHLWAALSAAGVARVESDVSASNAQSIALHLKEGFVVTSTASSDRWGSLVRLTKFLRQESKAVFSRQFSSMPVCTSPNTDRSRS
jgi:L-amino acid N-acyltransferase YncA